MLAERRHVLEPLAQRRHAHRDRVDAEVEVLAQPSLAQGGLDVDVGGADQPEVDADASIAPDRTELSFLQHAQQLGLQVGRHLADLVEQERPTLGHRQQPGLVGERAGEGATPIAEQFGLDQLLGQRRAVDLDEGPFGTRAVRVHRIGNQFLAGAVVAEHQDVGVAAGHRADQFVELEHLLALPHDRREAARRLELPAEMPVLDAEPHALGRALEFLDQLVWLDRTADDREGTGTQPLGGLHVTLATPHHDGVGIGQQVPPVTKGLGASGRTDAERHQQDVRGPHFDGDVRRRRQRVSRSSTARRSFSRSSPIRIPASISPTSNSRNIRSPAMSSFPTDQRLELSCHQTRTVGVPCVAPPSVTNADAHVAVRMSDLFRGLPRTALYNPAHASGTLASAGAAAARPRPGPCAAAGRPADGVRQVWGGDVPDACGVALPGVRLQDRLLRLVS